ncbi:glutamine amidotransferase [Thioalkalivibrio sp. ALE19]|uniref:glutamine amidotransferase n=1 Tax=Thioalkalivibrio sp. ALE19 TaxID=1266909 RepID=UPI001E4996B1|nr:glutamine amidotransferase [Thioalkalivibrio sp. ALE19]
MKPLLVIKTGTKIPSLADYPGDYDHWIAQAMGWPLQNTMSVDVQSGAPLPEPGAVAGVAITGSGSMVTEELTWMVRTAAWLKDTVDQGVSVLGICFGHQLLAWSLGGEVGYNPRGIEVGTTSITLDDAASTDPVFRGLPRRFPAQVSHSQSVLTLPPGAVRLGWSDMDEHQGFRFGEHAWGLQFHPEFDQEIVPHYVEYYRQELTRQQLGADALLQDVTATPESVRVLQQFGQRVAGREQKQQLTADD